MNVDILLVETIQKLWIVDFVLLALYVILY